MGAFDPGFTEAYSKATGQKQTIPEAWLEHPVLGKGFTKTPRQAAKDRDAAAADLPQGVPTQKWTVAQLTQYAAVHGIDVAGAAVKADYLTAIQTHAAAHASADDGSNTPDAGDEE